MTIKLAPCILPNLHIDLEADGPEGDERLWLFGSFDMWGARFHIECYRVVQVNDGTSIYQALDLNPKIGIKYGDWVRDFERLGDAHAPDDGFQTVYIDGADYVVTIYPGSAS